MAFEFYIFVQYFKPKLMKKITLLAALLLSALSFSQIVLINEVDSDQTGTDITEFLELRTDAPGMSLDGYIVVFYNGSDDLSYTTVDLNGFSTDANGYFIIGSDAVPGVDIALGPDNVIQNGADAIVIYEDNASNFPDGTPVTNVNLVDAIVYGTSDPVDVELTAALGEPTQYDEDENGMKDTESLQLLSDGTYCTALPTLRAENVCNPLGLNENKIDVFQIYPNPATKGYVNIISQQTGAKQVSVFDVLGKKVISTVMTSERLDITSLNSGIYIVKISQGNNTITKKLVIK